MRVIQGVDLPHSPKRELEQVAAITTGISRGRFQVARSGSYALVREWIRSPLTDGFEVSLYFQPHIVGAGTHRQQCIISTLDISLKYGFAVLINSEGLIELWIGTGGAVSVFHTNFSPSYKRWVRLQLNFLASSCVSISLEPIPHVTEKLQPAQQRGFNLSEPLVLKPGPQSVLVLAGSYAKSPTMWSSRVTNFFNGRIDSPMIKSLKAGILIQYDFGRNIPEDKILDISGAGHHGILINAPTRGVRGYNWDGTEVDWTKAKYGYGAIHFHEDDLDDAGWETDLTIQIPTTAKSGIYAVEVLATTLKEGKSISDMISFIVRTTNETSVAIRPKLALVLPTFTYLAYANDKLGDPSRSSSGSTGTALCDIPPTPTVDSERNLRRVDLGLSTYDVHNDDSGNVYSTAKRPIMNLKPGFVSYGLGRPRHLSAESMMIGFLEQSGIPYDILTDHDLHCQGVSSVLPYAVVITGGHPEYPTVGVYNAYENYAKRGGNLMYLGGDGFYWVTAFDPARPWRIEVRREDAGVRSYALDPGERHFSINGRLGGLWRSQARSSHALFGVAFCSQGKPPGVPYKRTNAGCKAEFKWMFEGIQEGELIGEHGLGGGASGDEMDSFDVRYGSPRNGIIVATSTGHPDGFGIASECVTYPILATRGTETGEVRSDMVYYETSGGGAVFSVGSINWYPSLAWDGYNNNVAKLTLNVIKEFMRRSVDQGQKDPEA